MKVQVKYNSAIPVDFATKGSACVDLSCKLAEEKLDIQPNTVVMVNTGISVWIDDNETVGLVFPRSSMGKRGLMLANTVGVIDSDYQGEIMLLLKNISNEVVTIQNGERVAQLGFFSIKQPEFEIVAEFSEKTVRNTGGFGSTGKI